jgi:predicted  nucleic acid-binding Zn-ribbon protein
MEEWEHRCKDIEKKYRDLEKLYEDLKHEKSRLEDKLQEEQQVSDDYKDKMHHWEEKYTVFFKSSGNSG